MGVVFRGVRAFGWFQKFLVSFVMCGCVVVRAQGAATYTLTNLSTLAGFGSGITANGINASGQVTGEYSAGSAGHAYIYGNGTLTDLGTLGNSFSVGNAINASGQVAGISPALFSGNGYSFSHGFLYSNGQMTDLNTIGGLYSYGFAINDSGLVTGSASNSADGAQHAILYKNGQMTDLGTLGGTASEGNAINASGQIAGDAQISGNAAYHAFLNSNGQMTDLGTLSGSTSSVGKAINVHGQVTGITYNNAFASIYHAFLYSNGQMTDLGTLGGNYSEGYAINDSGQVTGDAQTTKNAAVHAFLYSGGLMTDLGTLGGAYSQGNSVNASGQVVGYSYVDGSNAENAFLYTNGQMLNLNSLIAPGSGLTLTDAGGINDAGDIYGVATNASGKQTAFELTPIAVPEPTCGCVLAAATLGLRRRRIPWRSSWPDSRSE